MNDMADVDYESIKRLAREQKCRVEDLLALSRNADPYYAGTPTKVEEAEWFARLWQRFGFSAGVHLRRIHYRMVSSKPRPRLSGGGPYENTMRCWDVLASASRGARHLGLVAPDDFVDRRNPDPHLNLSYLGPPPEPDWLVDDPPEFTLPRVRTDLAFQVDFWLPGPQVTGYEYDRADQPYHLELWIEKSTMNGELQPLCRELGMNFVTSVGFQSITSAVLLLKRAARLAEVGRNKPVRVFYVADYDPAGDKMPVAVARQVEFFLAQYAPRADIKLTPVALTREQIERYDLPRIPIKETDLRRGNFEDRRGEGAVELDALEALHPGELANLVREAVAPYRDVTLFGRMAEAEEEAREALGEAWEEATSTHREQLDEIAEEAREICGRYEEELAQVDQRLQADLAPLKERLEGVRHALLAAIQDFQVDLPDRPEPDADPPDEGGWLFDSGRDYLEQLAAYKRHEAGE
jgi:hypothetical protein